MNKVTCKNLEQIIVKYTDLQDRFINLGRYELNEKINKIVQGFRIEFLLDLYYNTLSGGEKRIVALASLMIKNPDILILDEPTNHIDITTREILEDTLTKYQGTILFVSHDRSFINKIATKIINIQNKKLIEYIGNYDDYKNAISRKIINK